MHPITFASLVGIQQIVCWGTLTYAAAVFAPHLAKACGISIATVMTAYGVGLLTNAMVAGAATRWVLRAGAFGPGALGLTLLVAACTTLSQASHWLILTLGFMLAGVAMALTQYDFAFLTVRLHLPQHARSVITMITFFGALASTIMWPTALALISAFGPSLAWLALALISVISSLPAVLLAYRQPVVPEPVSPADGHKSALSPSAMALPWSFMLSLLGLMFVGISLVANLPLLLGLMQTPAEQIAWILSLFGIGQLFSRAVDFSAGRWLSTRATVVICIASFFFALGLMALTRQGGLLTAGAVFLFGCANGLVTVLRGVLPQLMFRGEAFAAVSGRLASLGAMGRALMPVVAAQALSLPHGLSMLPLACGAIVSLCGWMLWRQIRLQAS
jgi:hypothetical protein